MALAAGTRIGAYEIIDSLGAGGMGEVYRARDSRLDRHVAIKILPEAFAHDADRLARFEREAKTLAALNHPHVASIYGVEEFTAIRALILELVDGPTLADRIAQGPIPIDEALPIAHQIVDALEAAHEAGIIHRDLKPANVKVRADGMVKVLDFGLAKLASDPSATSVLGALSLSPTITSPAATGIGFILGTASYMAPEQARGRPVDKRADIWAFGCVLFEMLTGRRAFEGEDVTETVGAVIHKEPPWSALPASTPSAVRLTLRRCIEKNPKQRFRDIGDVRLALSGGFDPPTGVIASAEPPPRVPLWRRALPVATAVIIGMAIAAIATWAVFGNRVVRSQASSRFAIRLPDSDQLPGGAGTLVAVSPDGRTLVYRARRDGVFRLYRRTLDQLEAVAIGDPEAQGPFFSPDSRWVAYSVGNTLKRVQIAGGPSQTVTALPGAVRGGSWSVDDSIIVGTQLGGLTQVPAAGGVAKAIATPKDGRGYWYPQLLPGGHAVLYTASPPTPDEGIIEVLILETGERRTLLPGSAGQLLPTGHLVFERGGSLWAVGFDVDRLQVLGTPVPVVEGIRVEGGGAVQFAIADDGTFVYLPGGVRTAASSTLAWVDRAGHEEPIANVPVRAYLYPRVSPDGTRVALDVRDQENDVWIWDFGRRTLARLTFDPTFDMYPLWSSDGRRIVFSSEREKVSAPFRQAADGTGAPERLATTSTGLDQGSLSADGKWLVMRSEDNADDIVALSLDGTRPVLPLIHTRFRERNPEISPDGRWIAYQSNESGMDQVYVRPFPAVEGGRWQVSSGAGGFAPVWARNGQELFYLAPGVRSLMSVPIQPGSVFAFGNATQLMDMSPYIATVPGRNFDVSPDGRKFLVIKNAEQQQTAAQINVVLNWFDELTQKVPVR
jgi:serine/threonine-protein kinase